jgi:hypothetical protein
MRLADGHVVRYARRTIPPGLHSVVVMCHVALIP